MMKLNSEVLVVVNGEVVGNGVNWEHAQEILTDYLDEFDGNQLDATVHFYSTLGSINTVVGDFKIEMVAGDLNLDDENVGSASEEYVIKSGEYRGESFDDKNELESFLHKRIQDGDLTLEDVQSMDIERTAHEELTFNEADQGDNSYNVVLNGKTVELMASNFGEVYTLASEVQALVDEASTMSTDTFDRLVQEGVNNRLREAELVDVGRSTSVMESTDMVAELMTLNARITGLHDELNRRLEDDKRRENEERQRRIK